MHRRSYADDATLCDRVFDDGEVYGIASVNHRVKGVERGGGHPILDRRGRRGGDRFRRPAGGGDGFLGGVFGLEFGKGGFGLDGDRVFDFKGIELLFLGQRLLDRRDPAVVRIVGEKKVACCAHEGPFSFKRFRAPVREGAPLGSRQRFYTALKGG